MTRTISLLFIAVMSSSVAGCGIEPALSGKARSEYLDSIKPYLHYWVKPGMTEESRRQDSRECRIGGVSPGKIHRPEFKNAVRPGEKEQDAYLRLVHEWEKCMLGKGYRFTGKCYDNEIGRSSPACAGRTLEPLN
ncbi:MAG: hypothetical protein ACQER6_04730 [Pseudomonadota bacterium]